MLNHAHNQRMRAETSSMLKSKRIKKTLPYLKLFSRLCMQLSWPSHKLTLKLSFKKEYLMACTRPSQEEPYSMQALLSPEPLHFLSQHTYLKLFTSSFQSSFSTYFQVHFAGHSFNFLPLIFLYTCILCPGAQYEDLIAGSRCHLNQIRELLTGRNTVGHIHNGVKNQ